MENDDLSGLNIYYAMNDDEVLQTQLVNLQCAYAFAINLNEC